MDQPQPVSQVLSVPVHVVMTQILSTFQCHVLSCPHDLESGVLSDTCMDRPCGRRTDAVVTVDMLPAGDRRPHSPGGRGSWRGRGGGGPSGLSVDERERGSPGSPSEMSLSLPGPRENLSLSGHAPSPRGSNQNEPK